MPSETRTRKGSASTTRLIALGGEKQSGKSASANFIAGINLVRRGLIEEFKSNEDGSISVNGKTVHVNDIAPTRIKIYGFADSLKHIVCDLFNLDKKLAFGSDQDKETVTHIRWEDMPGVMTNLRLFQSVKKFTERKESLLGKPYKDEGFSVCYHEPGFMTIRQILQYFGTEVCRKIYKDCWTTYLMRQIKADAPEIAIIYDCRFDNEAQIVKDNGGLCVLLEKTGKGDSHISERGFINFNEWDARIQNQECEDVRCLNRLLYENLKGLHIFQ